MIIHRTNGEGIYEVAAEYGVSPFILSQINETDIRCRLTRGRALYVPMPTRTYTAKRNDTVKKIAERFNLSSSELFKLNPSLTVKGRLYEGQPLIIKQAYQSNGSACGNGYYFRGCSDEKLYRSLPYISYITVCAARLDSRGLNFLFDDAKVREIAQKNGKLCNLRVYCRIPNISVKEIIHTLAILAKSRGYSGITLAGNALNKNGEDYCSFILEMKQHLMEYGLKLYTEENADSPTKSGELFNGRMLSYEKLHLEKQPSFKDGELKTYSSFADEYNLSESFMDISSFGYLNGKYIPKTDILKLTEKGKGEISYCSDSMTEYLRIGKQEKTFRYESAESIEAKLRLLGELGFLGLSFDIARIPFGELYAFGSLYSINTLDNLNR